MAKTEVNTSNPRKSDLTASIAACLANGDRLLDDAMQVEFEEPPSTKLMLSMIAQEEFAKAFILHLVREEIVLWSRQLLRAMNDHACKQLVGVVIEYIEPEWETIEELEKIIRANVELGHRLPPEIASAINILRHEKIGRWESDKWVWEEEPEYERSILRIADGKRDRIKQDALYVSLGRDGRVVSTPSGVTQASSDEEYARANQHKRVVSSIVYGGEHASIAYGKVQEALKALFFERV